MYEDSQEIIRVRQQKKYILETRTIYVGQTDLACTRRAKLNAGCVDTKLAQSSSTDITTEHIKSAVVSKDSSKVRLHSLLSSGATQKMPRAVKRAKACFEERLSMLVTD